MVGNFIDYRIDPLPENLLEKENFFQLVQITDLIIISEDENEISAKTVTQVPFKIS